MEELTLRDELPGIPDERLDDRPLGRGESDVGAVGVDDALRSQIDGEVVGAHDRLLLGRRRPPQRGAKPGQQLAHPERLRHVVVGANVESGDLVGLALAHRENDDRHAVQPGAADHLEPSIPAARGRGSPRPAGGAARE